MFAILKTGQRRAFLGPFEITGAQIERQTHAYLFLRVILIILYGLRLHCRGAGSLFKGAFLAAAFA